MSTLAVETGTCPACVKHPGWKTSNESERREPTDVCRACYGSGSRLVAVGLVWVPPSGSVVVGSWRCEHCQTHLATRAAQSHRPGSSECLQDRLEREWSIGYDD